MNIEADEAYIPLGKAFEAAFRNLANTDALARDLPHVPCSHDPMWTKPDPTLLEEWDGARQELERAMREAFDSDALPVHVPDKIDPSRMRRLHDPWGDYPLSPFGLESVPDPVMSPGPNTQGRPCFVRIQDLSAWIKKRQEQLQPSTRRRRGRPHKIDWSLVQEEITRLMDDNGDFVDGDPEWNVQARLEERLHEFISRKFKKSVEPSTLRVHIAPALKEWREAKAGN